MEGAIVPLAFTIQNRFVHTVKYIYKLIKSIKSSSQVTFFFFFLNSALDNAPTVT